GVLYDANGTEITSDDDSGSGHNFKISRSITVGTYYVTVRHRDSSVTGGTYSLVVHFDDHGNSKDGATPISPSDTTSGSIETAGDVDWFKIVTTGPGVLAIGVTSQTAGDISVSLYNASSSTPITSGDSSNTLGVSKRLTAGTYYVKVKHRSTTGTGSYDLFTRFIPSIASSGVPSEAPDDYGNTVSTARTISPTSIILGNIETAGDEDWFKVDITSAGTLTMGVASQTAGDISVSLYNASSSTSITSGDSSNTLAISQSLAAGTYYVKVKHRSATGTGVYALSTIFTSGSTTDSTTSGVPSGETTDDHGNSKDVATSISPSDTTLGNIEVAGDEDWFKIVISHAGTFTVKTEGGTDTEGVLYDASDENIASDNDSGTNKNFKISKRLEAGTYYVKVSASSTGTYSLAYYFTSDDYGNIASTATSISPSDTTPGSIETAGDVDWFKIVIPDATILTVNTTGTTDTEGELYKDGDLNASDDNSGSGRNFKISKRLEAGTYYVKVKHHTASSTGTYSLVTYFDDYGDTPDDATSINPNSSTAGNIDKAGDEDWFKVVIPHDGTLVVETTGTTDTVGELYDVSGRRRIESDDQDGVDNNFKISRSVAAGTYYVKVKHHDPSENMGAYSLVTYLATPINPNSRTVGRIEKTGDVDWFKIVIPSGGGTLIVSTIGTIDTSGELYKDGDLSASDDNGSVGNNFKISQQLEAGTYYVKVSASSTGEYWLDSQFIAPVTGSLSDNDNSISTATYIEVNATTEPIPTTGNIEVAGDNDYFKIKTTSSGRLIVRTRGSIDTYGYLLDANGEELASNNNSGIYPKNFQ
ncbi:MAG: pre-peptidase C-terminal domain-containing protein, partial [Sulfurovum sp.]|nr:pre-peptidase C-terminal domain-containing protein [Sulfurovum sp.]